MEEMIDVGGAASAEGGAAREARQVPLSAMISERERRRAAERELEALRAERGSVPHEAGGGAFEALNARFHHSEGEARGRHGEAAVDAARAWTARRMQDDPAFARAVLSHEDPYAFAIERHAAQGKAEVRSDPQSRKEAPSPPRSLVSAPSAGGAAHTPVGPGQAFDALFRR